MTATIGPSPSELMLRTIDLADEAKVKQVTEALNATHEELVKAVEKVGPQPVAVAIFLGRPDAV